MKDANRNFTRVFVQKERPFYLRTENMNLLQRSTTQEVFGLKYQSESNPRTLLDMQCTFQSQNQGWKRPVRSSPTVSPALPSLARVSHRRFSKRLILSSENSPVTQSLQRRAVHPRPERSCRPAQGYSTKQKPQAVFFTLSSPMMTFLMSPLLPKSSWICSSVV